MITARPMVTTQGSRGCSSSHCASACFSGDMALPAPAELADPRPLHARPRCCVPCYGLGHQHGDRRAGVLAQLLQLLEHGAVDLDGDALVRRGEVAIFITPYCTCQWYSAVTAFVAG